MTSAFVGGLSPLALTSHPEATQTTPSSIRPSRDRSPSPGPLRHGSLSPAPSVTNGTHPFAVDALPASVRFANLQTVPSFGSQQQNSPTAPLRKSLSVESALYLLDQTPSSSVPPHRSSLRRSPSSEAALHLLDKEVYSRSSHSNRQDQRPAERAFSDSASGQKTPTFGSSCYGDTSLFLDSPGWGLCGEELKSRAGSRTVSPFPEEEISERCTSFEPEQNSEPLVSVLSLSKILPNLDSHEVASESSGPDEVPRPSLEQASSAIVSRLSWDFYYHWLPKILALMPGIQLVLLVLKLVSGLTEMGGLTFDDIAHFCTSLIWNVSDHLPQNLDLPPAVSSTETFNIFSSSIAMDHLHHHHLPPHHAIASSHTALTRQLSHSNAPSVQDLIDNVDAAVPEDEKDMSDMETKKENAKRNKKVEGLPVSEGNSGGKHKDLA